MVRRKIDARTIAVALGRYVASVKKKLRRTRKGTPETMIGVGKPGAAEFTCANARSVNLSNKL
jgi:hypothetical protein